MTAHPDIALFLATERLRELREAARAYRVGTSRRRRTKPLAAAPEAQRAVVIRDAVAVDGTALIRLAELDGKPVPAGALLVAEVDGEIEAALPLAGGVAIADPFKPTADLVSLLELRAEQMYRPAAPTLRRSPCPTPLT